jgi:hypothetical protein
MSSGQLSSRALNRALLDRQLLLRPAALPAAAADRADQVMDVIERLAGLQAQAPFPPYYGLWSRLDGFRPDDLAALIAGRRAVRIALMRATIHLVSARDCLAMRPLIQPVLDRGLAANWGKQLPGVDRRALAAAGRALVEERPMTFSELGAALSERWPQYPPAALAQGVRTLVPLVQVPPRAIWGAAGQARHTSAEAWLGQHSAPADPRPGGAPAPGSAAMADGPAAGQEGTAEPAAPGGAAAPDGRAIAEGPAASRESAAGAGRPVSVHTLDGLVLRYLAAFGPASVRDVQAWSGLTRLAEVTERLRPRLRGFRDENGIELFDLPDAPRPDPQTPVPVRLVAEFDNLLLSHADRSRIIAAADRPRLATKNGIFPGAVLVDGFAAGTWRISRSARAATLTLEPFGKMPVKHREAVTREGSRLLAFAAPDVPVHDIRFEPAA